MCAQLHGRTMQYEWSTECDVYMYIWFHTHPFFCFGLETMMATPFASTLSVIVGITSVLWQFMSPQSVSREPEITCADSILRLSDTLASRPSQQCSPITVSLGPFSESSFCRPFVFPSVHPLLTPEMAIFAWPLALAGWVSLITCHVCRRRSAPINVHTHNSSQMLRMPAHNGPMTPSSMRARALASGPRTPTRLDPSLQ